MENRPLISVLIPCYNHKKYIAHAINSVLNQTYYKLELLIADDCSCDGSNDIIESFKDERIHKFYFSQNKGTARTLNFLMQQANGEFLSFLGSDDFFYPDKLKKQMDIFLQEPSLGAIFTWADIVDENDCFNSGELADFAKIFQQSNKTQGQWLRQFFEHGNCFCHPSAVIRKDVIKKVGLFNPAYRQLHDFDYWVRLLCKYPISVIQEPLIAYRRIICDNESVSSNKLPNNLRLYNEQNQIYLKMFENIPSNIFYDGFGDIVLQQNKINKKDSCIRSEEEDFIANKYFVLKGLKCLGIPELLPAVSFLTPRLVDDETTKIICEKYGYSMNSFYDITSTNLSDDPWTHQRYDQISKQNLSLQENLENKQSELENVQKLFSDVKNKLEIVEGKLENVQGELDEAKKTIDNLYNSSSWKITAPMRLAHTYIRIHREKNKSKRG